jgi:hypothetical protein
VKLKRIHLKNFQCIAAPITIDLAPLTLLFGPNSVGKSTIADALELLSQLLTKQADLGLLARWIKEGATEMSIGMGYEVEDQELDELLSKMGLKSLVQKDSSGYLDLDTDRGYSAVYYLFESAQKKPKIKGEPQEFMESADPVQIDILFNFSNWPGGHNFILEEATLVVDGVTLVSITKGGRYVDYNRSHPKNDFSKWRFAEVLDSIEFEIRFLCDEFPDDSSKYFVENSSEKIRLKYLFEPFDGLGLRDEFAAGPRGSRWEAVTVLDIDYLQGDDYYHDDGERLQEQFLSERLSRGQVDSLEKLRWIFHGLVVIPARLGGALASSMLRVGPIRHIPTIDDLKWDWVEGHRWRDDYYRDSPWFDWDLDRSATPPLGSWFDGRLAWKYLAFNRYRLDEVNRMLSEEGGIGLGYEIECQRYSIRHDPEPYRRYNEEAGQFEQVEERTGHPVGTLGSTSFVVAHVRDVSRNVPVRVEDVGSGISQVVPVLAAIAKDQLISFIEQPELHLHPRAQSRIGDLLIRSVVSADRSKLHQPVMIVETHSEHVALRVLRRIREISGTDDAHNLSEKVIFYYFKKTAGETAVHRIGVDSCGRFVDIWPDGFFEDRVEDLFS